MAVNLRAPFPPAQALAPKTIGKRAGKVVDVSSRTSEVALDGQWANHNQSDAVCPTVIMSFMARMAWGDPAVGDHMRAKIPLGRFGKRVEIADLVLLLALPASGVITGQIIFADGGYTAV